jgi:signal transduction histidine kinase
LLLLARAEAAKIDLMIGPVAVAEVLGRVVAAGRWLRGRKELTIEVKMAGDLPVLQTDRGKLAQIALNLLANAIKFTPEGGTVSVSARAAGEGLEIEVADTGIGITDVELPRIFDEFHQVDGSSSRTYGGVGLGLALVRRLTSMLGGTVSVHSVVGKGSTFIVRLPR